MVDQTLDSFFTQLTTQSKADRIAQTQALIQKCTTNPAHLRKLCREYSADYKFTPLPGQRVILNSKILA